MKEFSYIIKDEIGIHARPAGMLAKLAKEYSSVVTVCKGDKQADVRKLMAVMGMGIKCNDEITVKVDGEDEEAAFEAVKEFFENTL